MAKKISILMAYAPRRRQLKNTLQSYRYWYEDIKDSIELVVINDTPESSENPDELEAVLQEFCPFDYRAYPVDRSNQQFKNPGVLYNMAASLASAELLHITNPENLHMGPILKDAIENHSGDELYSVYGCKTFWDMPPDFADVLESEKKYVDIFCFNGWYQHSNYNHRMLHFATVISAVGFHRVGGFDPRFQYGVGLDDNDFIEEILKKDFKLRIIDDLYAAHQPHSRSHWISNDGIENNERSYLNKWGRHAIPAFPMGKEKMHFDRMQETTEKTIYYMPVMRMP
tara:strand:+ start:3016 stop:3870 length:855 start_codon:yes stop_codon:yes gene_type:complete